MNAIRRKLAQRQHARTARSQTKPTVQHRGERPLVYLSVPLPMFRSGEVRIVATVVRAWYPGHLIITGQTTFSSTVDWRVRLNDVLRTVAVVVFCADGEGWIGRGVHREIASADSLGIPVVYFDGARFRAFDDSHFVEYDELNWQRFARVSQHVSRSL